MGRCADGEACRWTISGWGKPADSRFVSDQSPARTGWMPVCKYGMILHIFSGDEVSSACVADSSKRLPHRHATVLRLPPTVPVGCGSKRCHANGCQTWLPEAAAKCCHYCQCIWHALVSRQLRRRLVYHNRYSSTDAVFPGSLQCQSVHFTRACAAHL